MRILGPVIPDIKRGLFLVWTPDHTSESVPLWIDNQFVAPSSVTNGPIADGATRLKQAKDFTGTQASGERFNYAVADEVNRHLGTELTVAAYVKNGVKQSSLGFQIPRRIITTDDSGHANGTFILGWNEFDAGSRFMQSRVYTNSTIYNANSAVGSATAGSEGFAALQWKGAPEHKLWCWWQGQQSAPTTTVGGFGTDPVQTNLFVGDRGDAARGYDGHVSIIYAWDRMLSDAELRRLSADPLLPLRPRAPVPVYPHYSAKRFR
jgi:hypothetical protein